MLVKLDVEVHGLSHDVEMAIRVRVRYDESGKWEAISVEPGDLGLFDHVLNTRLGNQSTG
jgi:hypothetical protein